MLLDEVDKLGRGGVHGDPAAALLEVLDPEQNATFRDAYLGVPFDLSKVTFIATANMLDTIPGPLRDRMEIIELPGYTESEKVAIAARHLVAKQIEANGLTAEQCEIAADDVRTHGARLHARSRRTRRWSARIGARLPARGGPDRGGRRTAERDRTAPTLAEILGPPQVRERSRDAHRACPASRPGSPGRRSAAMSCSSKRAGRRARASSSSPVSSATS